MGHFGSYLLDPPDRQLVLDIVQAGAQAAQGRVPIFVKIRLLETLEQTMELCQQLKDAGASLIAIHARYRASWERKGPGARDGPALLDQVTKIKEQVPGIPIIANGNVITPEDVENNLKLTHADGIMSAEGILDNPALFLPCRHAEENSDKTVSVVDPLVLCGNASKTTIDKQPNGGDNNKMEQLNKKKRKFLKKLREIERIQERVDLGGDGSINDEQRKKLAVRSDVEDSIHALEVEEKKEQKKAKQVSNGSSSKSSSESSPSTASPSTATTTNIPISKLYETANDKIALAKEYMTLADHFGPTTMRTKIFHVRRMLRDTLNMYQLMEDCLQCTDHAQLVNVIQQCQKYRDTPELFMFDREKAKQEKEALERKRHEEGKRKAYEARMIRKAKREGKSKDDLDYYLRLGAAVPTRSEIVRLKSLDQKQQLEEWKHKDHSQHCLAHHLEGCKRGRGCAFLHVDSIDDSAGGQGGKGEPFHNTTFEEQDEVAG